MKKAFPIILVSLAALLLSRHSAIWQATPLPEAVGSVLHELETARKHAAFSAQLLAAPPAPTLPVPVLGVSASGVADTFGDPRGTNRTHQGIDVFAPRGTYVVSATEGIVVRNGTNELGGNVVFVMGPGGERYYYAHLNEIDPYIALGTIVGTTTIIGTVGTSGNATGTPPHLHFGVYGQGGARNPYERFQSR